jgi:hypothetical protein
MKTTMDTGESMRDAESGLEWQPSLDVSPLDDKEDSRKKNNSNDSKNNNEHGDDDDDDDDDDSSPREESTKRTRHNAKLIVKIVSASFGPCEGRRLLTGELSSDETSSIPHTRDVTPFLRALLIAQQLREARDADPDEENELGKSDSSNNDKNNSPSGGNADGDAGTDPSSDSKIVRMNAITEQGMQRATIVLGAMKSMNAIFGDPCPGTSKRLHVHYLVREEDDRDDPVSRAASSELLYMSFAEHERVVLQRRVTLYQEDSVLKRAAARAAAKKSQAQALLLDNDQPEKLQDLMDDDDEDDNDDETMLMAARRMGRAQSISDFAEDCILGDVKPSASRSTLGASQVWQEGSPSPASSALTSPPRKWRLRSATSEIVLPVVMPFLEVIERVQCRLVCRLWRHIVRDWGVAVTIDNNDPSFPSFTRPFLRGILSHSYSSLQSLFLSGSEDLQQSDLHPSIPHLRKLRSLDISRCVQLDDSTLHLLSQHVSDTLEVLYIKGLRKVTDDGVISIAQSCSKLKVLEVSYIPITDQAGIAIGEHLTNLRAVYMRDNYLLTNRSIDVITEKCTRLEQLTLWGCTRLQHLSFDQPDKSSVFTSGSLVLLNLWGCHSLKDDAAIALAGMSSTLRTLIVSECHRLTDAFVVSVAHVTFSMFFICCERKTLSSFIVAR